MTTTHLLGWSMVLLASAASDAAARDLRLVEAARHSNREAVRALLQQKIDVNEPQPDGATALHWAAYRDDLDTASLLIHAGANVNAVNELGVAPLYLACDNGSTAMVQALLTAGANPNATLPSGETALMTAARSGGVGAVKALLARGAKVNAPETRDAQTALMWAVSQRHPDITEALIAAGADVKARSNIYRKVVARGTGSGADGEGGAIGVMEQGGYTPLLFASRVGDVASARLLLAAGADVNDTTPDGASALVIAAHSGQSALATFLLEKGADPNAARAGYTALHLAVLRDDTILQKALLAHRADPNARLTKGTVIGRQAKLFSIEAGLTGATPFFLAAKYADPGAMRLLTTFGADPKLGLPDGTTPLMVAAGFLSRGFGRTGKDRRDRDLDTAENELGLSQNEDVRSVLNSGIDAVKLMVELGADVNAANRAGDTALHGAASHGYDTVITYLVSKGAKVNAKNKRGRTPLMVAESKRDADDKSIATVTADLLRRLENQGGSR